MSTPTYVTNKVLEALGDSAFKTFGVVNRVPVEFLQQAANPDGLIEHLWKNACRGIGDSIYEQKAALFENTQSAQRNDDLTVVVHEDFKVTAIVLTPQLLESALTIAYRLGVTDTEEQQGEICES